MRPVLTALSWCLIAAYPLLVFAGLKVLSPAELAATGAAIALLRLLLVRHDPTQTALCACLLAVCGAVIVLDEALLLRFYPVLVNASLLALFSLSLLNPPSMIERVARMAEPELPPHAVAYTRRVTQLWSVFFAFNMLAAAYTALYSSDAVWAAYNGGVAYGLIGLLFTAEWLVRQRVKKSHDALPE